MNEVLDRLVAKDPSYQYKVLRDRLILFLISPEYESVIAVPNVQNIPRRKAASMYVERLRARFELFADPVGPGLKGDPRSPVYADQISLDRSDTVIGYLAQLLRNDPELVFSIVKTKAAFPFSFLPMYGSG